MANCQHVKTKADLDRLLAERAKETDATDPEARLCIHVDVDDKADGNAEALEWQRQQQEQIEIKGEW